jgi:hypothetical protein
MNSKKITHRIMAPGSNSIYCTSGNEVSEQVKKVMENNGFGYIYTIGSGVSRLVARFEPFYGIVMV